MINFDDVKKENIIHKSNWPQIPDNPYTILTIGGSGSGKTSLQVKLLPSKSPNRY